MENVHLRKMKTMEMEIRRHRKETKSIDKKIEGWCEDEFEIFGTGIKETLKEYAAMIGRLEIV